MFATRFAPSPTGLLHLGHAASALLAHDAARAAGGRFVLRIEDIDTARCRREFEAAIHEDLAWLGIDWERPVRRQSEHLADHQAALERLRGDGLLYRCFRTRREVAQAVASAPHGPGENPPGAPFRGAPLPPHEERARLAAGQPFAWRLSLDAARARLGEAWDALEFVERGSGPGPGGEHGRVPARPERAGDVVLARRDVGVAYHLAVVVDDALQEITDVVRGEDLFEAAHVQRLLQALLGLPAPVYRHHPLLLDETGERLAKRRGSESLRDLRVAGATPAAVRARVAQALARAPAARPV